MRLALVLALALPACGSTPGELLAGGTATAANAPADPVAASEPQVGPPVAGTPAASPPRLRIPPDVAGFRLAARRNFPPPQGSLFRYVADDSLYADLYLYPGPDLGPRCDLECGESLMAGEVEGFETVEMPETVNRGQVASYEILATEPLAPGDDAPWLLGWRVRMTLTYPEREGVFRSDYVLHYMPFHRVKVRVTYVETPGRNERIQAFLEALFPELLAPPGRRAMRSPYR